MTTRSPDPSAAFHRVLESREALLEPLVDEAEAFLSAKLDDDELIYRVVLLLSEAATNAMKHGNALDPTKHVRIDLTFEEGVIEIRVCDEGPGFDPAAPENPLGAQNLLRPTGRGIFLIKEMADDVRFEDDGRCVIIRLAG